MINKILLSDRTTGKNILWANSEFGAKEIQAAQIIAKCLSILIVQSDKKFFSSSSATCEEKIFTCHN